MNINEISGSHAPAPGSRSKKLKDEAPRKKEQSDRVELSREAQALFETGQSKRLAEIQKRIINGFYTRNEVMHRVVDALIKDLIQS